MTGRQSTTSTFFDPLRNVTGRGIQKRQNKRKFTRAELSEGRNLLNKMYDPQTRPSEEDLSFRHSIIKTYAPLTKLLGADGEFLLNIIKLLEDNESPPDPAPKDPPACTFTR